LGGNFIYEAFLGEPFLNFSTILEGSSFFVLALKKLGLQIRSMLIVKSQRQAEKKHKGKKLPIAIALIF